MKRRFALSVWRAASNNWTLIWSKIGPVTLPLGAIARLIVGYLSNLRKITTRSPVALIISQYFNHINKCILKIWKLEEKCFHKFREWTLFTPIWANNWRPFKTVWWALITSYCKELIDLLTKRLTCDNNKSFNVLFTPCNFQKTFKAIKI